MSLSRRGLFGTGLAGAAGVAGGFGLATATRPPESAAAGSGAAAYELFGTHQPGIVTPVQDRLHFAAFDLVTDSRADLVALLRRWTSAADRMMRGLPAGVIGPTSGDYDLPPDDTGEAIGLPPAGLTVTFGFGPGLFDRLGLSDSRPAALRRLPHFPGDNLRPERSDGDLCVQACSDDPQVAVHAIRNLARIGFGTVAIRWSQLGFGKTSATTRVQDTPRNLFGFKDGTANILAEQTDRQDEHVWVSDGPSWLVGGTYLVARRINMTVETWDRQSLREQERVLGRTKAEGAPLSGGGEFDEVDFAVTGRDGAPLVEAESHVALAHPSHNGGVRMLRRGYNFVDGTNDLGRLDAGLFFIAFIADPQRQYVPMQTRMAQRDLLVEYLQHTGSGLYAIPPGVRDEEDFIGSALLG